MTKDVNEKYILLIEDDPEQAKKFKAELERQCEEKGVPVFVAVAGTHKAANRVLADSRIHIDAIITDNWINKDSQAGRRWIDQNHNRQSGRVIPTLLHTDDEFSFVNQTFVKACAKRESYARGFVWIVSFLSGERELPDTKVSEREAFSPLSSAKGRTT